MVAPVPIDAQNQTEDILKTEAWASIPSRLRARRTVDNDNQFKDTNRFCFYGSESWVLSNTFTQRLTSFHFLTLRTMHTLRASIFDRTTQTNQKENGIIHQPILFSKQRDYVIGKTFDADATLHSVSLRYAIYTGNVWHPFL
jgi:hypothetical protein